MRLVHETCACKCRLDANVWNARQQWNNDKCRCKCKELPGKSRCDDGFIWNPCVCECECDKSCDAGEYLGYVNCECRKRLIDKLCMIIMGISSACFCFYCI